MGKLASSLPKYAITSKLMVGPKREIDMEILRECVMSKSKGGGEGRVGERERGREGEREGKERERKEERGGGGESGRKEEGRRGEGAGERRKERDERRRQ